MAHIFYSIETLKASLIPCSLSRQGALSCPATDGRKEALVAAVYGLGLAAAGIIHAWHLNAPIQNLSFPQLTYCFLSRLLLAYCSIISKNCLKSAA